MENNEISPLNLRVSDLILSLLRLRPLYAVLVELPAHEDPHVVAPHAGVQHAPLLADLLLRSPPCGPSRRCRNPLVHWRVPRRLRRRRCCRSCCSVESVGVYGEVGGRTPEHDADRLADHGVLRPVRAGGVKENQKRGKSRTEEGERL